VFFGVKEMLAHDATIQKHISAPSGEENET
jgi:hypothetical protein